MTTLSSLNRHACATLEDVGSPKVIAMQKYFKKVAPWAQYVSTHLGPSSIVRRFGRTGWTSRKLE
jgi:tRNA A37 threonylcarbamoyladenosine dehydratase